MFLIGILFLFAMAGCVYDKSQPTETVVSDLEPIPSEIAEDEAVSVKETESKEYSGWVEAYLDVLVENSIEIENAKRFGIYGGCTVAILDAFSDETPVLLLIYRYEDSDFFYNDDQAVPCLALKILSYSGIGGIESIFDSNIFFAAGGGNNYCVFYTYERELMLYRSITDGGTDAWGIWPILANQNFETDWKSLIYKECDLAKIYYACIPYQTGTEIVIKNNGKEVSKEQYDKIVEGIIESIEYMVFPGLGEAELYHEEFWKDVTPFEERCMTYDEAIAWLEAQKDSAI